jgi:extracellular factor (EF) 3-hydroxypalmitic acid methyl ester biosynthesis protein
MDSIIVCRNSQGFEVWATPLRMDRHAVVFEVYNPYSIIQLSEVLSEFKITMNDQVVYSGRGVVSNLLNTGIMLVCEATLDEGWLDVDILALVKDPQKLQADFAQFLKEWDKVHKVIPDFKIVVADIQTLLVDLRRWFEQVELGIRSQPLEDQPRIEREVITQLRRTIVPAVDELFERFERVASNVDEEVQPAHRSYIRRQIHPLVLCSPFAYRTYQKPLGYAGDYEMVNMILRDPFEGSSTFAKMVNLWFLSQVPAQAHRNRVEYLTQQLVKETRRVVHQGRAVRIFNLGCGPAREIQNFLTQQDLCDRVHLTLLDFNDETLTYTGELLKNLKTTHRRSTEIQTVKKSVHQILKDTVKPGNDSTVNYDLIYCAGLFDYLSDRICKRLMDTFYAMLAPGGLLVATNVDPSNPIRNMMEYVLEWHLIYRDDKQMQWLCPDEADPGQVQIQSDPTGANSFLEVRKAALL